MHERLHEIMSIKDKRRYRMVLDAEILRLVPEMKSAIGLDGGCHHNETVYEHLVLASLAIPARFPLLRFAALLHDIGKPATHRDGHFLGHAKEGAETAKKIMRRLGGFTPREQAFVINVIESHMMPLFSRMREAKIATKFKRLAIKGVSPEDFVRMRLADRSANLLTKQKYGHLPWSPEYPRYLITTIRNALKNAEVKSHNKSHNPLAVTGRDVMEILDISQGPEVGEVLRAISGVAPHDDREALLDAIRAYSKTASFSKSKPIHKPSRKGALKISSL